MNRFYSGLKQPVLFYIILFMNFFACNEDTTQIPEQQAKYKIAFVSLLSENNIGIFVMDSDGANQERLTSDTVICYYPEWSSDGMIVYIQKSLGTGYEIWSMNSDGSNKNILSTNAGDDWDERARWSTDNNKILFRGSLGGLSGGVCTINADGSDLQLLSDGSSPSWSKDATKIVFLSNETGFTQIFIMEQDGANKQQLTSDAPNKRYPVFSPDGSRIAFSQDDGNYEIYAVNVDGTNKQRLTNDPGDDRLPNWNQSGTQIVFLSNRTGSYEVYVINADGTNLQRLTNGANVNFSFPSWSPDAMKILFASSGIKAINNDGSSQQNLTAGFDMYPVWSPIKFP